MDYQEGPDRPQRTEMEKINEEIEEMERAERLFLIGQQKSATSNVYAANILALFFFIIWMEVNKEEPNSVLLLIFSLVPLLAIFSLFMIFKSYKPQQIGLPKHLFFNFYVMLFLFFVFLVISLISAL